MQNPDSKIDYGDVVRALMDMFGDVIAEDLVYSVVENFEGDLQESANAVMLITMDADIEKNKDMKSTKNDTTVYFEDRTTEDLNLNAMRAVSQPTQFSYSSTKLENKENSDHKDSLSYASASSTGAVPKKVTRPAKTISNAALDPAALQFKLIITYHNEGTRTLILLRGASGSGKSYLAQKIIDTIYNNCDQQNYETHIFCADKYFMRGGVYCYVKSEIQNAHAHNQKQAKQAMIKGVSPVIIDNTNTEIWEMEQYVRFGVENGYIIEVMEPNTPWARKKYELLKRNIHNVPINSIKRMLDRYESGVNGTDLIMKFRCDYNIHMRPPVKRLYPPFVSNYVEESNETKHETNCISDTECMKEKIPQIPYNNNNPDCMLMEENVNSNCNTINIPNTSSNTSIEDAMSGDLSADDRYKEVQIKIEEMEQFESEWENGENWEDKSNPSTSIKANEINFDSKPQRQNKEIRLSVSKNLMSSVKEIQDWSKISLFMPPWEGQVNNSLPTEHLLVEQVEKVSSYTCIESGDTDIYGTQNPLKIVSATPRDINEYHLKPVCTKIPQNWMLDKSTSTNDNTNSYKCPHEEEHFTAFSKLFKSIPKAVLRDIFDKCHGDVNWAVDLVLDSMSSMSFDIIDRNDSSDTETENQNNEQCECLAAYNIIPQQYVSIPTPTTEIELSSNQSELPQMQVKKGKKEISEESIQLKRQIEQNIVIAEKHYSQHCLKIRKMRRGEFDNEETANTADSPDDFKTPAIDQNAPSETELHNGTSSEETCNDDDNACGGDSVSIELPKEFIVQLDQLFGRKHMSYPENITSNINIPMSILKEINALWTQSLAYQLEEIANQKQLLMIQQDEEFARQLAKKEAELSEAGKEPEIPDFKEIMDMDFAISLYQKDIAEWRSYEPTDLAARLSREKLHNLFPDILPDTLSELLMAHNNNFLVTVEVLLISTGKIELLKKENAVNRFIMETEMERQEKILEMERQALSEVEWPLLKADSNVDMAAVDIFRKQADEHMKFRNIHYQKAQDYMRRGMTSVASYYSGVAAYHKQKFEQANSLAAATLMQVHAKKCTDNAIIDLHFLRVGEAKESLDLFLDVHIQKVKEIQARHNAPWHHKLYFITGRGLHSNGRPKVKPAVIKRLLERGLTYIECNPGLLCAKVYAYNLLSDEIE